MSQSTTNAVSFVVTARMRGARRSILNRARSLNRALGRMPTSAELVALTSNGSRVRGRAGRQTRREALAVQRLESRLDAVDRTPGAPELMQAAAGRLHGDSVRLLSQSRRTARGGEWRKAGELAIRGDRMLRRAIAGAATRLAGEERELAASALEEALQALGFHTIVEKGEVSTGVEGRRGHEVFLALVRDGGTTVTDQAGYGGWACKVVWAEIRRRLEGLGAEVREVVVTDHGDERGGVLIQRSAQAARGKSLAWGAVRQKEHPEAVTAPPLSSTAAVLPGHPHRLGGLS